MIFDWRRQSSRKKGSTCFFGLYIKDLPCYCLVLILQKRKYLKTNQVLTTVHDHGLVAKEDQEKGLVENAKSPRSVDCERVFDVRC